MPITDIKTRANCDEVTIVWRSKPIGGCRGFALERQAKGSSQTAIVPTWVGFKGQQHKPHESRPSTTWPVQRYIWSDLGAKPGQTVRYRVYPMTGPANDLKKGAPSNWSDWRTIATGGAKGLKAYFNRGIVPAQAISATKPSRKSLQDAIGNKQSATRKFLSGELRTALLGVLADAKKAGVEVYAALYELNDPELIDALKAIGGKCNLILGSGAYKAANKKKHTPAVPDENADVRKDLRLHSSVNVHDRLVKSPHFAHNKFVVICDKSGKPVQLWTGSTNWTKTGLCTQVNNGLLIDSPKLATAYRARWEELKDAGAGYPPNIAKDGSTPAKDKLGSAALTAWNVPAQGLVDLKDAEKYIKAAKQGVLFLMLNPGPNNSLLNAILSLNADRLLIHGVVNQDPGGKKHPLLKFTHKGKQLPAADYAAILPKALANAGKFFDKEMVFNMIMIHSKVVVIDPFGKKPVVMTGSHNLGPKASGKNDDNLVIIENAPELAEEYAVNLLGVYGHYKWLYNLAMRDKKGAKKGVRSSPQYDGNFDDDKWQTWYQTGMNKREIDFWLA